jgi:hypothetical protein
MVSIDIFSPLLHCFDILSGHFVLMALCLERFLLGNVPHLGYSATALVDGYGLWSNVGFLHGKFPGIDGARRAYPGELPHVDVSIWRGHF